MAVIVITAATSIVMHFNFYLNLYLYWRRGIKTLINIRHTYLKMALFSKFFFVLLLIDWFAVVVIISGLSEIKVYYYCKLL